INLGEPGLGKSTFINSLFQTDVYKRSIRIVEPRLDNGSTIENITYELIENGMKMLLTITDSPGFGVKFNRSKDLEPIVRYIDDQYENYYEKENKVQNRKPIHDTRIHLCFYFINPTGHKQQYIKLMKNYNHFFSLKELDILTLKELSSRVNLIPLIAKADSFTNLEKIKFKAMILEDFKKYNISVYPLDYAGSDYPKEIYERIPFCIIGSDEFINLNGQQIRGRQYPWGIVEVENPKHSDFIYLRKMLMEYLLADLQEWTHHEHYHNYRAKKLL
ncbi:Septin-type guanine nucleotide-binding (G) domain-containing protein, partial [Cunninghamella echinulata]